MFHLLICNIHIQTALYPPMYHVLHVFSTFLIHTHTKQQKLKKIDAFSPKQNSKFFLRRKQEHYQPHLKHLKSLDYSFLRYSLYLVKGP